MRRFAFTITFVVAAIRCAFADSLLPTEPGTTWRYGVIDQAGGVVANEPRTEILRIAGTQEFEGKRLLKFETLRDETLVKTELYEVSERGVICCARGIRGESLVKVDPPQTVVPGDLKAGATWESDGVVADMQIHQRFTVAGEEDVYVPAGKFHAFRLHMEDTTVIAVALDRWFTPGIGVVKEETTLRGPGGTLLQRTRVELQKTPELLPLPTPSPTATPLPSVASTETPRGESTSPEVSVPSTRKRLIVEVTDDAAGGFQTHFKSNTQAIYVRWHGHGLPEGARVRVAWVAEDVGDIVDPNFIVDQTETVAPAPDSSARFTLGRPEDGWADGKYRVEFYVNGELEETVHVTVGD
jgi:hypothetical protein